jgi:hypothetical protein
MAVWILLLALGADDPGHRVEVVESATIDWTELTVTVVGEGRSESGRRPARSRLEATAAAREDAERQLLELLPHLRSRSTGDATAVAPTARLRIQGLLSLCQTPERTYATDGEVRLTVVCPLGSGWTQAAHLGGRSDVPRRAPAASATAPATAPATEAAPEAAPTEPTAPPSTSANVDATSLILLSETTPVVPALLPEVRSTDGRVWLDASTAGPEALFRRGLAAYAADEATARALDRAGSTPLLIRVEGVDPDQPTRMVVGASDAARLQAAEHLLEQGRVVVVSPRSTVEREEP